MDPHEVNTKPELATCPCEAPMLSCGKFVTAVGHTHGVPVLTPGSNWRAAEPCAGRAERTTNAQRSRRPGFWRGFAALLACVLMGSAVGVRADASSADLHLPHGYVTEKVGAARFSYPVAARDEVRNLEAHEAEAWQRVAGELGAKVSSELDIRVATNPEQMQALAPRGVPLPGYADGIAFPEQGLILLTLTEPDTWLRPDMRGVLTHELSHVALYRAVAGSEVPRWFTEGLAVHQAGERSFAQSRTLWEGTIQGRLLSLDRLSASFPLRHNEVDLAYAQSADFVSYMQGSADDRVRFRQLLGQLATHVPFADAVKNAYHVPLGYMEREWRNALSQRFGRWPAFLIGLSFIWTLGAILLVIGYVRTRIRHKSTLRRWEGEEAVLDATHRVQARPLARTTEAPSSGLSAQATPPIPQSAQTTTVTQGPIDDFFDNRRQPSETGVPTVVHDGQSHTLH